MLRLRTCLSKIYTATCYIYSDKATFYKHAMCWMCWLPLFEDNIYIARDVDNPLPKPQDLHCQLMEEISHMGIKTTVQIWQWFLSCPYMGQVCLFIQAQFPHPHIWCGCGYPAHCVIVFWQWDATKWINRSTSHEREWPYMDQNTFDSCWTGQIPIYIRPAQIITLYNKICV